MAPQELYQHRTAGELQHAHPSWLVEMAFGRRPFPPSSGLFYLATEQLQEAVISDDRITMVRLHDPDRNDAVPGVQFAIGGFQLLLAFGPFPTDGRTISLNRRDGGTDRVRFLYHPTRLTFASGNVLTIEWNK